MTTLEVKRFQLYQNIYYEAAPSPAPIVTSSASGSTKAMSTRRAKYGETGLSQDGKKNLARSEKSE